MKHIAAYILCVLGGNASPSADDVNKVLSSVGAEANEESLNALMGDLEGKDVAELMLAGKTRLVETMGSVAVAVGPAGGAAGGAAGDAGAAAAEPEKEEEPEEVDLGGGMDMFGGGDDCKFRVLGEKGAARIAHRTPHGVRAKGRPRGCARGPRIAPGGLRRPLCRALRAARRGLRGAGGGLAAARGLSDMRTCDAEMQKCRNAELQNCRTAERQNCRNAEMRRRKRRR